MPEEVAEWLRIDRKKVFALPIQRRIIGKRTIRYREDDVEEFINRNFRPQGFGFLKTASIGMNRNDLSLGEVAKLLRTRRSTAAAFIAPHRRISLSALLFLLSAVAVTPSEG